LAQAEIVNNRGMSKRRRSGFMLKINASGAEKKRKEIV
jgi:hypothetical protein